MKPAELVEELRSRGYRLRAEGDRLICRGRTSELAETVIAAMKAHKPAILQLLADEQEQSELLGYGLARCPSCRRIMCLRELDNLAGICDDCMALPLTGSLFEEGE